MSSLERHEPSELNFDHAAFKTNEPNGPVCLACKRPITDSYYQVNGQTLCPACLENLVVHSPRTTRFGRFAKASLFGFVGALAGAFVIYLVRATTGFEAGIISIFAGFMVGSAIKKGTGSRGGRVYQFMAVFLTYSALSWSFLPEYFLELVARKPNAPPGQAAEENPAPKVAEAPALKKEVEPKAETVTPKENGGPDVPKDAPAPPPAPIAADHDNGEKNELAGVPLLIALVTDIGFLMVLSYEIPVYSIAMEMPQGLITLAIIFWGLQTAWTLTQRHTPVISGPFRLDGNGPEQPEAPAHV